MTITDKMREDNPGVSDDQLRQWVEEFQRFWQKQSNISGDGWMADRTARRHLIEIAIDEMSGRTTGG